MAKQEFKCPTCNTILAEKHYYEIIGAVQEQQKLKKVFAKLDFERVF